MNKENLLKMPQKNKTVPFTPFNEAWRRSMSRFSIKDLESFSGLECGKQKKYDFITAIRAKLIVHIFNSNFKPGDKLSWRPATPYGTPFREVTLANPAFLLHGIVVAFFEEYEHLCSVEPQYLENYYPCE